MSDVQSTVDNRVRLVAAVLSVSDWPALEQAQEPHAVHNQAKIAQQFMQRLSQRPLAVDTVNHALAAGCTLDQLFAAALAGTWPSLTPQEALPAPFDDGTFNRQLADCQQTSAIATTLWPRHEAVWQEAREELAEIFTACPLPQFLAQLLGRPLSKPIVIVPTLIYPMLNAVVAETAEAYHVILPPPKAWGESPPWPFRDGEEWALGETCRVLLAHLLGDVEIEPTHIAQLQHAATTLFLEKTLTPADSLAYLVRAKRQYQLPQLPQFTATLRACLEDDAATVYTLIGVSPAQKQNSKEEYAMSYEFILTRTIGRVGLVQFNRPKALNALSPALIGEAMTALEAFDTDEAIGCMVVTGNERAFAAGADIKAMANASVGEMLADQFISHWDRFKRIRKPVVAAVSGYALGGGCEFALACDMIIASETAKFGQPEIKLGIIPGAGGTQRLTKAVGKALAMEIVLNDRLLTAEEAARFGLVNCVVPTEVYLDEAIKFAAEIADRAPIAVKIAKEAINASFEMPLAASIAYERRVFNLLFATEDQKEGMAAFIDKRPPQWQGR